MEGDAMTMVAVAAVAMETVAMKKVTMETVVIQTVAMETVAIETVVIATVAPPPPYHPAHRTFPSSPTFSLPSTPSPDSFTRRRRDLFII